MKKWFLRVTLFALAGLVLFGGIAFLRLQLARNEIRRETQALSTAAPLSFGETQTLEITPLYEADSSAELQGGHGVSYLIRTASATILFDLGFNPTAASPSPLEQNMARLSVPLSEVDMIVISHRHPDHVGGQNWWIKKTFSLDGTSQPALGSLPIYIPEMMSYPGSQLTLAEAPTRLAPGVATTGLIAYAQPFPVWLAAPKGYEQSLAINVAGKGIVLVTGCGHMGLNALLARAGAAFDAPVVGVVGGLHYGSADAASLQPEIQLVQGLDPQVVALSPHDSGPAALEAFAKAFPAAYHPIRVGSAIQFSQPVQPASGVPVDMTLDYSAVAQNVTVETVPAVPNSENVFWTEVMPQYTRLSLQAYLVVNHSFNPQIFIYPAGELAPANENAGQVAAGLQALLQSRQAGDPLPFLPLVNARQALHAQVQYLDFKSGQGVRFLTQFNQGPVPINNNQLIYTFQGLTSDGKYYLAAVLPVTNPELPDGSEVNEQLVNDFQGYLSGTVTLLNQQPAGSFAPDLDKLDALIRSIEVK